jgi:hypothetical protein
MGFLLWAYHSPEVSTAPWEVHEIVTSVDEGGIAIDIVNLMLYHCNDELLADYIGVDNESELSDDARVSYVRGFISGETLLDDGVTAPSMHHLRLEDHVESPFLCCLIQIHGQAGAVPVWVGLFANETAMEQCLRDEGFWLFDSIDELDDVEIIEAWKRAS